MTSLLTRANFMRAAKAYAAYKVYRVFYPQKVKDLAGTTVLVTGAATGLGKAIALLLASRKDIKEIILWDIQEEEMANTEREIKIINESQKVKTYAIDLSQKEMIYDTAADCIEYLGGQSPDVIINNAGIISGGQELLKIPDNKIELENKINVLAHMYITKAFLPKMIQRGSGHFANVASMAAYVAAAGMVPYAASKAGARGVGEGLSLEMKVYGYDGIKVSTICPSHIDTPLFKGFDTGPFASMTPEYVASKVLQAVECEIELVQLPYSVLPFIPIIAINNLFGKINLPALDSPMKSWDANQAEKLFGAMESKM